MDEKEEIKYHTITRHWGNPAFCKDFSKKIESWLQQFDDAEKPMMLKLLGNFYYYTEERINSKVVKLYRKFKEEFPADCENAIYAGMEKDLGVGYSSFIFDTFWIKNGLKDNSTQKLSEEIKTWDTLPESFAIIDDYSGSGSTFIKYLNKLIKIRFDIVKAKFYFLVIHISQDSLQNICEYSNQLGVSVQCIYLNESERAFSDGYIYEAVEAEIQKRKYEELCKKYRVSEENFFGYKQIAALVSFAYNTPNNTLGIFWNELDDFMALFHRHKRRRTSLQELRSKARQNKNFRGEKVVIQNIEETKLNMFMVYCVAWGKNFSVSRACYDFGLTQKQFNDLIVELIEEKYLEYDEGKLIAAGKMQKYVFSSRISDFKKIYYDLKQKDFLPTNVDELDSYIPINFDKRR